MSLRQDLRVIGAFFRRDAGTELSYRAAMIGELAGLVFVVVEPYFLSRIFPSAEQDAYFAFVVVGLVVLVFLQANVLVITGGVRNEEITGTLEVMLATGVSGYALAAGLSAYPIVSGVIRGGLYTLIAMLLGLDIPLANWPLALAILGIGSLSFVAVGLIGAGLVFVISKAGAAVGWMVSVATLLAGVLFPLEVLPGWLRVLSSLSPATWALQSARAALLEGATLADEWRSLLVLALMGAAYLAIALAVLTVGMRHAKRRGRIGQY